MSQSVQIYFTAAEVELLFRSLNLKVSDDISNAPEKEREMTGRLLDKVGRFRERMESDRELLRRHGVYPRRSLRGPEMVPE